jgi:hypothetical protein
MSGRIASLILALIFLTGQPPARSQSKGSSLRVPLGDILAACDLNPPGDSNVLEQAERELILQALRESNWVVGGTRGASARLRLNRTGVSYKIKKSGISRPRKRGEYADRNMEPIIRHRVALHSANVQKRAPFSHCSMRSTDGAKS